LVNLGKFFDMYSDGAIRSAHGDGEGFLPAHENTLDDGLSAVGDEAIFHQARLKKKWMSESMPLYQVGRCRRSFGEWTLSVGKP
jgi:hypothetical protein